MSPTNDPRPIVYSTSDQSSMIEALLNKLGDINSVIYEITRPKNCSREGARQCADAFAKDLGITEADFMKRWKAMR